MRTNIFRNSYFLVFERTFGQGTIKVLRVSTKKLICVMTSFKIGLGPPEVEPVVFL